MIGGEFIKIADPKSVVNMRNSSSASHRVSESSYNSRLQSESEVDEDRSCCCLCFCCGYKSKKPVMEASEPLLPSNESSVKTKSTVQQKSSDCAPSVLEKFISQNENDDTRSKSWKSGEDMKKFSWLSVFNTAGTINDSEVQDGGDQSISADINRYSSHPTSGETLDDHMVSAAASTSTSMEKSSTPHSAALQQVMENHNKKIHATFPTLQPQGSYLPSSAEQDEPGGFSDVAN